MYVEYSSLSIYLFPHSLTCKGEMVDSAVTGGYLDGHVGLAISMFETSSSFAGISRGQVEFSSLGLLLFSRKYMQEVKLDYE